MTGVKEEHQEVSAFKLPPADKLMVGIARLLPHEQVYKNVLEKAAWERRDGLRCRLVVGWLPTQLD